MRKIPRLPLESESRAALAAFSKEVRASPDRRATAKRLWKKRKSGEKKAAFADIHATLKKMAPGRERCMYCEDSHGCDTDHFRPKASYPKHTFSWKNLLLACARCNREKSTNFPLDTHRRPLLLDPTRDNPEDHFYFCTETGFLVGMTDHGKATEEVFGLNRNDVLLWGRLNNWRKAITLVRVFKALYDGDKSELGRAVMDNNLREPDMQWAMYYLVRLARQGSDVGCPEVADFIRQTPGEWDWAL